MVAETAGCRCRPPVECRSPQRRYHAEARVAQAEVSEPLSLVFDRAARRAHRIAKASRPTSLGETNRGHRQSMDRSLNAMVLQEH